MKLPDSPHLHLFLRRLLLGLVLAGLFAWLALRPQPGTDARLVEHEFLGMGTVISVSLYLGPDQTREAAEAMLRDVEGALRAYEARWHAWDGGALAQVNAALARGERAAVAEPLRPLFARAADLSARSGGHFDVRIGELVRLWGFHDELHFRSAPPLPAEIAGRVAALQAAPMLDGTEAYGPAAQVRLDFGAIAKGDAIDQAIAQLRTAGYDHAIVNLGGNLRAAGRRGERPWRIGIRHPRPEAGQRLLATLEIERDEAVVTSGDYERYFEADGRRFHHLLDPHSGQPAQGLQAVTVVADNGALADAASTALFVAGRDRWRDVATALDLERVLVVEADGSIRVTTPLAARLRFSPGLRAEVLPWPPRS